MSPTIAEAAQDYHDRRKWKPVPISRKTKKPIGKKWQERPARPLAVLQLRAWARARLWQAGEFDLQTAVDACKRLQPPAGSLRRWARTPPNEFSPTPSGRSQTTGVPHEAGSLAIAMHQGSEGKAHSQRRQRHHRT